MKICYIADAASIHTQRWVRYFAERGHDVHLISFRAPGDHEIEDIPLHLIQTRPPRVRLVSAAMNFLSYRMQMRRLLGQIRPDVLHAHYVIGYGLLGALSGFHPFVLSAWGSDVLSPPGGILYKKILDYSLKRADRVTTTSIHMREHLIRRHGLAPDKVVRIPWGINLSIFRRRYGEEAESLRAGLGIPQSAPVIISSRGLAPHYNIQTIVRAVPSVVARFPDAVFLFLRGYGTPGHEDAIRTQLQALGVIDNAIFVSRLVSPEEMAIYLNAADILVSIPGTDQFAANILEGMACGAIPIVGRIEVYRQFLSDGDNAFFVDPGDSSELASKIVYCLDRPGLREAFYEINRKIVEEEEDWHKNAPRMDQLYMSLLPQSAQEVPV